ncbi:MAG: ABC transporter permease [Chitinophagales bacterium]
MPSARTAGLFRRYGMLLILLLIVGCISLLSKNFLTLSNFLVITRQVSINGLVAAGMTLVILLAGIDLSVGGVIALAGALLAMTLAATHNVALAVLVGLGVGAVVGTVNGLFVSYLDLPPFIVTLASLALSRGATLVITEGRPILVDSPSFEAIGGGYVGAVPIPVLITAAVYAVLAVLLYNTRFGRQVYAIGGNEAACRMSGIDVGRTKTVIYALCGALAGLTSIVLTSRLVSAQPTAGSGYELDAIAAVILGGTSMSGGVGGVGGTIVGAFIIGVLGNGLNLLNVSPFYQDVAKGLVILVAIVLDRLLHVTAEKESIRALGRGRGDSGTSASAVAGE